MAIDRIRALVGEDFDAVNKLIIDNLQSQIGLIDDLSKHIISSGGKRLRPLILLLSAHAFSYKGEHHIPLAAMVEFFHTATLLHDDVIDESTLRRGKETANEIWGSKASILVGDYLFTQSVKLMVDTSNLSVLKLMANASNDITRGEVKQLINRHNPSLDLDTYFDIIKAKTAVLFAASACIGSQLSQQPPETQKAMYEYGLHLGYAFQMVDDALDYCSDSKQLGKNIGDDLADGKATMPLIHAYRTGTPAHQELIETSLKQGKIDELSSIQEALKATNAIEYTLDYARSEVDSAINALLILPDSLYKEALIELAMFAVNREH